MENKKNNKGFSLVELIVVVAIMAVLVAVLAPTLLRYVEKTRIQKDESAVSEVVEAAKIACAQESVATSITSTVTVNVSEKSISTTGETAGTDGKKALEEELKASVPVDELVFSSNAYKGKTYSFTVSYNADTQSITIGPGSWGGSGSGGSGE